MGAWRISENTIKYCPISETVESEEFLEKWSWVNTAVGEWLKRRLWSHNKTANK